MVLGSSVCNACIVGFVVPHCKYTWYPFMCGVYTDVTVFGGVQ